MSQNSSMFSGDQNQIFKLADFDFKRHPWFIVSFAIFIILAIATIIIAGNFLFNNVGYKSKSVDWLYAISVILFVLTAICLAFASKEAKFLAVLFAILAAIFMIAALINFHNNSGIFNNGTLQTLQKEVSESHFYSSGITLSILAGIFGVITAFTSHFKLQSYDQVF